MKLEKKIPAIAGITCDSREVKPGYAFVAITGFNKDGNKYIKEAIEKGAGIIFTEKKIKMKSEVPIIRVKDTRFLLGQLAAEFYDFPSRKLKLIGVTGTNGKTTTTHLIYHLLNYKRGKAKKAGLIGTVNVDTGRKFYPGDLTTPPPVKLQQYLKEMVDKKLKYACMEVSSHGIKLKRIAGSRFAVKVGTNISIDHYDLHPSFPDYLKVKKAFLQDNNCSLVLINHDDNYLGSLGKLAKNQVNFAIYSEAEVRAEEITNRGYEVEFIYKLNKPLKNEDGQIIPPCRMPVKMKLFGEHNIYNALAAITIALYYGISPELIQEFFRDFQGVWRRLQVIYNNDFTIIDDCAHNPGSYEAVFKTVKKMRYNKIFIINSLRGNRGIKINRENAETISKCLTELGEYQLFTSNCNDVVKPVDLVSREEEKIFLNTLDRYKIKYQHFQELKPTLKLVLKKVTKDNLILLLGPHAMDHAGEMILGMI